MNASDGYIASTELHQESNHHQLLSSSDHHGTAFRGCDNYWFDGDHRQNFYVNGHIRGHVNGRSFYTDSSTFHGTYKGCIGTDLNIYDAKNQKVGYLDSCGNVHKNDGTIVLSGKNHSGLANVAYYLLDLLG